MKVYQILENRLHAYYPQYATAAEAATYYSPELVFVDAPDTVFDSWGWDETKQGDARFIMPTLTPEMVADGWLYDAETGTFYNPKFSPASNKSSDALGGNR